MSKRDLKKYLEELNKEQLEEQIMDLYEKFIPVKTYYDFVFNPKEEILLQESKVKISNEYFPIKINGRRSRPKMRRSVAQKIIKHFIILGVDPFLITDLMLFNIEIAQAYSNENRIKQELFYKSMFNSFEQAVEFSVSKGIYGEFKSRIMNIYQGALEQHWSNEMDFERIIARL